MIMRSNFEENAGGLGGAIYLQGKSSIIIIVSENNFSRNHADIKGAQEPWICLIAMLR